MRSARKIEAEIRRNCHQRDARLAQREIDLRAHAFAEDWSATVGHLIPFPELLRIGRALHRPQVDPS